MKITKRTLTISSTITKTITMAKGKASFSSRNRDDRQSVEFSQSGSSICFPVTDSPSGAILHPDPELLRLAQIGVLTKKTRKPILSGPSLLSALAKTLGDEQFLGDLTTLSILLDEELASSNSVLNLASLCCDLPQQYKKKAVKAHHAEVLIHVHTFYQQIKKAMSLRQTNTRVPLFSSIKQKMKSIEAIMSIVNAEAEQEVADCMEPDTILKSVKVSDSEWKRGYMMGGGKAPPNGFDVCPFCQHPYVDVPPKNNKGPQKKAVEKYLKESQHLRDFKSKDRSDPPKDANGNVLTSIKPPKVEKHILRCHCSQFRRAIPNSHLQSTCPIRCVNQKTQEEYAPGECPICTCQCNKAYFREKVQDIKSALKVKMEGPIKKKPCEDVQQWLKRAHDTGDLAKANAMQILTSGSVGAISEDSTRAYLEDISGVSKATSMVQRRPGHQAEEYIMNNVVNAVLLNPNRPSVICLDGTEIDLRTTPTSSTASSARTRNNKLKPMPIVQEEPKKSPWSNKVVAENDEFNNKMMRMQKRLGKYMHGAKRLKQMSEDEKEERSAAIKANKLYSDIIKGGDAKGEIRTISNALEAANELEDGEFDSQKYNDCFMNINAFED